MKTENNINKFLAKNTIGVFTALVVLIIVVVYSVITNNTLIRQKNNYYVIATDGKEISLQEVKKNEIRAIEILNHLAMFVDNYYNITQNDWERKVNKALWLGDLKLDFQNRNNSGYYANIVQWAVERKAELQEEDVEIILTKDGAIFKIILPLTETYSDKPTGQKLEKKYKYFMQGTIREVAPNFPYNPHGLYIENFREDKRIEIVE